MYRMLIVDDERIIRETLSRHIDWAALDVQVIGTASNGLEAYDIIMDEYPDIVMTDIKMPGFSGLELLQRIKSLHPDIEFILLSGYGEFEYAQKAMQWGVRHYLLKPCSDEKIIASVQSVTEEISRRRMAEPQDASAAMQELGDSAILNLLNECIAQGDGSYDVIYAPYKKFLDFDNTPYELCYLYFLDSPSLQDALSQIHIFREKYTPGIPFYAIYVQQCLLFFFRSYHLEYDALDTYMSNLRLPLQEIPVAYKRVRYANLSDLMDYVNSRICHFATVQYSNGDSIISICNYRNIIRQVERLTFSAFSKDSENSEHSLELLCELVGRVSSITFLKQLISTIIMLASSQCYAFTALEAAEFRTHAEALRSYQAEDGLFHTVIDDATSYEEASGTAAMAAGLLRGMKAGILDESYRVCADRAITALCDCVDTDGTVLKVSAGTAMGMNAEHYKGIGIRPMAYGQALTLIALCEALQ